MTKTRKPYNPAEAQERRNEVARLRAMGAEVNIDQRTGKILSAKQSNVFNLLLARKTITQNEHDAVMRFATLWAVWKSCDGGGERAEKVDGATGDRHSLLRRQLAARNEVERILPLIGRMNGELLRAFMRDYVELDQMTGWRVTVARITGIQTRNAQAVLVAMMCKDLKSVMEAPKARAA